MGLSDWCAVALVFIARPSSETRDDVQEVETYIMHLHQGLQHLLGDIQGTPGIPLM